MNAEAYLNRIGLSGPMAPTKENLARIQKAHLQAVPYENLDILLHRPIVLEKDALYTKIVENRRGGYCFEVNELLGHLLRELGYEVADLFGRFLRGETGIPMRRHHVLMVKCMDDDTPYVADVGVGTGSPNLPVRMVPGEELQDGVITYRLTQQDFFGWVLEDKKAVGEWGPVYSFTEEPQAPIDFVTASFWCEHADESIFNKGAMVSLRTETGRRTIDEDEARIFDGNDVTVLSLKDMDEKRKILRDWFGIVLPDGACV